jgi:hypothetical protein
MQRQRYAWKEDDWQREQREFTYSTDLFDSFVH